ncbi:molybdopterin molybdenumtransferase MoeA [Marinobacterium nitratireducens]|uniref:Molybdopterin molybdenumtransferase n=1 Tax=Marinobacterium nitratireducens TaxID=518897 RepID=A0A918DP83_9GAMM|nr:gephyrin-like molybdotransferase Glp [Marinobacterium nitratireducens]GGO76582.1 molybdopterin molybdenumtransferase MoeA [Marinobacterium nitratireducens]
MSGCGCDAVGEALIPFSQALEALLDAAEPVTGSEWQALDRAAGRVLAEDVMSPIAVPPADNSAMDGYALALADLGDDLRLPLGQRIAAGQAPERLLPGTAARIFTGAPIPYGANCVVMQEEVRSDGETIQVLQRPQPGDHIRRAGQDIEPGQRLLAAGTRLGAAELGVLASVGMLGVKVRRRLRVAVLNTGDELVMPGRPCAPGQIYNSNHFTLLGLLQGLDIEVWSPGIVVDSPEATRAALKDAAGWGDLVLSSGGVSVGDEDHVKGAVESLGELSLWRVAIKPGKPLAFGRVGTTPFIGLPGNPGAVLVTFLMLARPYLLRMQGRTSGLLPRRYPVLAGFSRDRPIGREEYLRVRLDEREGILLAEPVHNQSSGVLSSALAAEGLLVVPPRTRVERGMKLDYIPFAELGLR